LVISAHARTTRERGRSADAARSASLLDLLTAASSNENERQDREDRRDRNQDDQDDNDDGDDWSPPPPPPGGQTYQPPPPPPDQGAGCLGSGGALTVALPGGSATVKVFQDNVYAELSRVDPSSIPSRAAWWASWSSTHRLAVRRQPFGTLPNEANSASATPTTRRRPRRGRSR
jgi:hypothetical protein